MELTKFFWSCSVGRKVSEKVKKEELKFEKKELKLIKRRTITNKKVTVESEQATSDVDFNYTNFFYKKEKFWTEPQSFLRMA